MIKKQKEAYVDSSLWADHYQLNTITVKEIINRTFSDIEATIVLREGSGWDFTTFKVNESWIFRFPKREEYNEHFKKEIDVMAAIGTSLPLNVPDYVFVSHDCHGYPNTVGGYKKIYDTPLFELQTSDYTSEENARRIGEFLTILHSGKIAEKISAIAIRKESRDIANDIRERTWNNIEALKSFVKSDVWDKFKSLQNYQKSTESFQGKQTLIHDDFGLQHIIFDQKSKTISGVIDWTDMAIGDPASDLACIWAANRKFYQMIMKYYAAPVDGDFFKRVKEKGIYAFIGDSLYGYKTNQKQKIDWSRDVLKNNFDL